MQNKKMNVWFQFNMVKCVLMLSIKKMFNFRNYFSDILDIGCVVKNRRKK